MQKFRAPAPFCGFQSNANEVKEHMIKGMEHTTKAKECAKKAKDDMHEAREHTIKATSYATGLPDANITMKASFRTVKGDIIFYTTIGILLMYTSYNTWQIWNICCPRKAAAAEVPKPLQTAKSQL